MGCEVVKVYKDHGISGTKGRDKRPAFDKLCRERGVTPITLPQGARVIEDSRRLRLVSSDQGRQGGR